MTAPAPVRVAVVGCGRVFERFHWPAIRRSPSVQLVAACDADRSRLGWLGRLPSGPRTYAAPEEMLREVPDAVLVLTPPATHASVCVRALEAGCHVLVEKPMALTPAEAVRMAEASARSQRRLQVGYTRRFREPYRQLRAALQERSGLRPRGVEFELAFSIEGWRPHDDFLGDSALGGGVMDDVLSHQADLAAWLFGQPRRVRAKVAPGSDGSVVAELDTAGPRVVCRAAHGPYVERLAVELDGGTVLEASGQRMRDTPAGMAWRRERAWLLDRIALAADRLRRRPTVTAVSFDRQLADFVAHVRGEPGTGAGAEDGITSVRVVSACRASAANGGAWVGLGVTPVG